MSNSLEHIQPYLDSKIPLLLVVDDILSNWTGEGCYQFPVLLIQVQLKMGWGDDEPGKKQLRANDPIIRDYIRNHPDWYVTRGAGGGIMRASERQKKEALLEAKRKAKEEMNAALDAEVVRKKAEAAAVLVAMTTPVEPVIPPLVETNTDLVAMTVEPAIAPFVEANTDSIAE